MRTHDRTLDRRTDRLDDYLDANDLSAVWFAEPNSFAWLTGGDNVVSRTEATGVGAAGYVRSGGGSLRVVTNNVEAGRLRDEELPDAFEVDAAAWHESSLAEAVAERSPTPAAADFDVPGLAAVDATELRQPLVDSDIDRYRRLCRDVAGTVESVCREVDPGDTERGVAADLRGRFEAQGVRAPVVLVGGADRAPRYRHYTPTDAHLGEYALVSVTAERRGLFASATRTVAFDAPEWLTERHGAAMGVDVSALGATRDVAREGGTAADVFDRIRAAYDAVGRPDEWTRHHQGGAAGFAGREWIATPALDRPVHAPMAYAWNPTVEGAKSEDTVLVTGKGFELLTATGDWPTARVEATVGDAAVERHTVLHR